MSDSVTLAHPDLPDRWIEVTESRAVPLRKIGWFDSTPPPPKPRRPKAPTTIDPAAEPDKSREH